MSPTSGSASWSSASTHIRKVEKRAPAGPPRPPARAPRPRRGRRRSPDGDHQPRRYGDCPDTMVVKTSRDERQAEDARVLPRRACCTWADRRPMRAGEHASDGEKRYPTSEAADCLPATECPDPQNSIQRPRNSGSEACRGEVRGEAEPTRSEVVLPSRSSTRQFQDRPEDSATRPTTKLARAAVKRSRKSLIRAFLVRVLNVTDPSSRMVPVGDCPAWVMTPRLTGSWIRRLVDPVGLATGLISTPARVSAAPARSDSIRAP
jgi:hypothetical protein